MLNMNDDVIYNILSFNFPRMEMVTLLKNEYYIEKYKKYVNDFNSSLTQQIFYSNCKDMYYLFLFERNNTTLEDINSVFLALDERGIFSPPYYFSIEQLIQTISDVGDDLWNFYFYEQEYSEFWREKVKRKMNKLHFKVGSCTINKFNFRNVYALNLID